MPVSHPAAERILALAEEEHRLLHEGRVDELDALHERREAAMRELPETLPAPARDALTHALALQRQVPATLGQGLAATAAELGRLGHGRTAARGYAPAGLDPRRTLDRVA